MIYPLYFQFQSNIKTGLLFGGQTIELVHNPKNLAHFAKEIVATVHFLFEYLAKEYALLNERYCDLFETMNTQSNFILNESNAKYQKTISRLTWVLIILTFLMAMAVDAQIYIAILSL